MSEQSSSNPEIQSPNPVGGYVALVRELFLIFPQAEYDARMSRLKKKVTERVDSEYALRNAKSENLDAIATDPVRSQKLMDAVEEAIARAKRAGTPKRGFTAKREEALRLRFGLPPFEGELDLPDVGMKMNITANAAKELVNRAMWRIRPQHMSHEIEKVIEPA